MKLSIALFATLCTTISSATASSSAVPNRNRGRELQYNQLCMEEYNIKLKKGCTYESVYKEVNDILKKKQGICKGRYAHMELNIMFNMEGYTLKEQKAVIDDLCVLAYQEKAEENGRTFEDLTDESTMFTEEYMNGRTYYNEARQTVDRLGNVVDTMAKDFGDNIKAIQTKYGKKRHIELPDIVNFEECELRSIMCCWTQDRQAGDNNGNCATPYEDNCVNADPGDNTDLCYVDNVRNLSPGVHEGYSLYPGDNGAGEGALHCHGFAWAANDLDQSAMYKGNNMFYVSMYDHLAIRGYVRNVPGAPMCGCLEQMPVVTRSDCTQINAGNAETQCVLRNGQMKCDIKDININFNACQGENANNNLEEHYKKLVKEKKATKEELSRVQQYLVGKGNCNLAVEDFEEELLARQQEQ